MSVDVRELSTFAQFVYFVRNIDTSASSRTLLLKVLNVYIPAYLSLIEDLQRVALNHAVGFDYFEELKQEKDVLESLRMQLQKIVGSGD